jgi:hypothetical protein
MNGKCDICGQPAEHLCRAPGCTREMCREHSYPRVAADLGREYESPAPVYCPEHAFLLTTPPAVAPV